MASKKLCKFVLICVHSFSCWIILNTDDWLVDQVLAFPAAGSDENHLYSMMNDVLVGKDGRPFPDYSEYQGRPTNVDAPPIERFREVLAGR